MPICEHTYNGNIRCGSGIYRCKECGATGCKNDKCSNAVVESAKKFKAGSGRCGACGASWSKLEKIENYQKRIKKEQSQQSLNENSSNSSSVVGAGIGAGLLSGFFGKRHKDFEEEDFEEEDTWDDGFEEEDTWDDGFEEEEDTWDDGFEGMDEEEEIESFVPTRKSKQDNSDRIATAFQKHLEEKKQREAEKEKEDLEELFAQNCKEENDNDDNDDEPLSLLKGSMKKENDVKKKDTDDLEELFAQNCKEENGILIKDTEDLEELFNQCEEEKEKEMEAKHEFKKEFRKLVKTKEGKKIDREEFIKSTCNVKYKGVLLDEKFVRSIVRKYHPTWKQSIMNFLDSL